MGPACQRKRTQVFSTKIESESTLKWRLWREFFHAMDWPDWPVTQQIMVIWSRCLRCTTWGRSMIPIIPYSTHDTQEAPPNRMKWQFNTLWHEGWPQNENGVKKYSGILIVLQGKILTYFSMQQFWHLSISSHWVPHWSYPFIRSQVGLVEVVDHPMDRIKHLKHREKDTAEIRTLRCPRCRKKRGLVLENPL